MFSKRHKLLKKEFSGVGEISGPLRNRISVIVNSYISSNKHSSSHLTYLKLNRELTLEYGFSVTYQDLIVGKYFHVFDVIEKIYNIMPYSHRNSFRKELREAFLNSGSVYKFEGEVFQTIEDNESNQINSALKKLEPHPEAMKQLDEAIVGLLKRKSTNTEVIKTAYLALEKYLTTTTETSSMGSALKKVKTRRDLHPIQKKMLDGIVAYRGDAKNVAHTTGNDKDPDEIDALWYILQVSSFINLI